MKSIFINGQKNIIVLLKCQGHTDMINVSLIRAVSDQFDLV